MWSHFKVPFTKDYLIKKTPVIVIIRLMLSLLLWPKVITLSGFYCTNKSQRYFWLNKTWSFCCFERQKKVWKKNLKEQKIKRIKNAALIVLKRHIWNQSYEKKCYYDPVFFQPVVSRCTLLSLFKYLTALLN